MIAKNELMKNLISLGIKKDGVPLYNICQLEAKIIQDLTEFGWWIEGNSITYRVFLNEPLHAGGLGSRLPSKFSPNIPAPWIIFLVLPKLIFQCSLNYFCCLPAPSRYLGCSLMLIIFLCSLLPRLFPLLPRLLPLLPAPCSLHFFPPCSQLPGCFALHSPGSLKPQTEAP